MKAKIKAETNTPILKQLAELETMPTKELRKLWDTLYEAQSVSEPKGLGPKANDADNMPAAVRRPRFNRQFLIKHLSYRIQELAFGGLEKKVKSRMDRLLDDEGYDDFGMKSKSQKTRLDTLLPGTLLVREWRGERHEVIVGENKNFEYLGMPYRSLSAVARKITGTRWNGPKFFGCREKESMLKGHGPKNQRLKSYVLKSYGLKNHGSKADD